MTDTPKSGEGARRYGDARAAFLGQLEAVKRWVAEGRTLRAFFDDHKRSLPMSYSQFTRHANKYLGNRKATNGQQSRGSTTRSTQPQSASSIPKPVAAPQFHHDADPGDKNDLI